MEFEMLGYTIIQNDSCTNVRVYRGGRLVCFLSTRGALNEQDLFEILALVAEAERGEV